MTQTGPSMAKTRLPRIQNIVNTAIQKSLCKEFKFLSKMQLLRIAFKNSILRYTKEKYQIWFKKKKKKEHSLQYSKKLVVVRSTLKVYPE